MEQTDLIIIFNKEDSSEYLRHSLYFGACWGSKKILVIGGDNAVAQHLNELGQVNFTHYPGDVSGQSLTRTLKEILNQDQFSLSPEAVVICQDCGLGEVKKMLKGIIPSSAIATLLTYPLKFVKEQSQRYESFFRYFNFSFYSLKFGQARIL